jgi:osmotically-inducible protein OsmY
MPRTFGKFLAALSLLVILGGCSMFTGRETPGQYFDDTAITTSVKTKILAESSLKVLQINVETMQGVVQLSGFVDSTKSSAKAVELAKSVGGVKSVQNNLVVRPKS